MKQKIFSLLPSDFPWLDQILWVNSLESTNDLAKKMAAEGAPHGTVIISDSQTNGRGRQGRSFLSPASMGVYMSVILRCHCPPASLMHLTCSTAVAMCNAVSASVGFRPAIKWTNDLVYGRRKLAGILTELSLNSQNNLVEYAVVGIGINCCQKEEDFPPELRDFVGSLCFFSQTQVDRAQVAASMIQALHTMDAGLHTQKAAVMAQYRADCMTINKDISLIRGNEVRYGHAVDVNDNGELLVSFPDGSIEAVNSGEISVRGMYGYV